MTRNNERKCKDIISEMLVLKVATLISATMMANGGKMLPCLGDCTNSAGTLAYSWCETKGSTWRFYNITLTKNILRYCSQVQQIKLHQEIKQNGKNIN